MLVTSMPAAPKERQPRSYHITLDEHEVDILLSAYGYRDSFQASPLAEPVMIPMLRGLRVERAK